MKFLAYDLRRIEAPGEQHFCVYDPISGEYSHLSLSKLLKSKVTFCCVQSSILLDIIRESGSKKVIALVDIADMAVLAAGRPGFSRAIKDPRRTLNLLSKLTGRPVPTKFSLAQKEVHASLRKNDLKKKANWLSETYSILLSQLREKNEINRWESVEKPLASIITKAEYRGVKISRDLLQLHLENIDKEIRAIERNLRVDFKIQDWTDKERVSKVFRESGLPAWSEELFREKAAEWKILEDAKSPLVRSWTRIKKLSRYKSILLRCFPGRSNRAYPVFDLSGTVTSRILVKDPSIQNLPKHFRNIVVPAKDRSFVYIDYRQFEPAILLASIGVNKSRLDIYESLAFALGGQIDRDTAKVVVMSYLYGIGEKKLERLLKESFGVSFAKTRESIRLLKSNLPGLDVFLKDLLSEYSRVGSISTEMGNHRYMFLSPVKNGRRLLSHYLQGTGALLLKLAILRCSEEAKGARLLLPMHDGAVFEVSKAEKDRVTRQLVSAFEEAPEEIFPGSHFQVDEKSFRSSV
ncbi:MAG: DNA polymerase [Gammaproteobacteria bacterium]|nr:DNA polymerase [Gammaproteobacteria bacterium]